MCTQITKTLGSISTRHRSDTFVSDRCLIDIDPRIFVTWELTWHNSLAEGPILSYGGALRMMLGWRALLLMALSTAPSENMPTSQYLRVSVRALAPIDTDKWPNIHRSQNAPVPYPTMLHPEQKCAHFCSEWSIVGYGTGAFWDLWNWSIGACCLASTH